MPGSAHLISLGPCPAPAQAAALRLAQRCGLPLVTEFPNCAPAVLPSRVAHWLDAIDGPKRWLHVGHPFVQGQWRFLLERPDVEYWTLAGQLQRDPIGRGHVLFGDSLLDQLGETGELRGAPLPAEWSVPAESAALVARTLDRTPARSASDRWSEPHALHSLLRHVVPGPPQQVLLGNSLGLRTVARVSPGMPVGPRFFFTRGVNGIDGGVAHALGAAMAAQSPTLALLGDVTFVHDAGALALAPSLTVPTVLVVVDNAGGHIFDALPVARDWDERPRLQSFLQTPPTIDWAALCQAYGAEYHCVEHERGLEESLSKCWGHSGVSVIRLVVDSGATLEFFRRLSEDEPGGWGHGL